MSLTDCYVCFIKGNFMETISFSYWDASLSQSSVEHIASEFSSSIS